MKFTHLKLLSAVALAGLLTATSATATTFSNTFSKDIQYFGAPDTSNYGQVFNTSGGYLSDWSFFARGGSAGYLDLVIAKWDGLKAVGPALYTSSDFSYQGGLQTLAFSNMATDLTAGAYIAYITIAGVSQAARDMTIAGSSSDGGMAGGFRFSNTYMANPLSSAATWYSFGIPNMQYVAHITPVPEPENYALLLAGLGLMGATIHRRKAERATKDGA